MTQLLSALRRSAAPIVLALCAANSLAQAAAKSIDKQLDACLETPAGQTTAGMVSCTGTAIAAWDRQLNETYQTVLKALDPKSRGLLRVAQHQWVSFRKAEAAAQGGPWLEDRSSIARLQVMASNMTALKSRISELKLYLQP